MSIPVDKLLVFLQGALRSELHADSVLVRTISTSEWCSDVLSEDSGGLTEIIWKLFILLGSNRHGLPVLACGLPPKRFVEAQVRRLGGHQLMLWQWPGFTYLPYGFSERELLDAARGILEGAKEPLPPGLVPERSDILRVSSEVRHWLENRRRNVESILEDFVRAAHGEIRLHHSHLDPVMAISQAHQRLLRRLWALERAASRFAPATACLGQMKMGVEEFTNRWVELEAKRAALKTNALTDNAARLTEIIVAFDAVNRAIDRVIAASRALDAELLVGEGK